MVDLPASDFSLLTRSTIMQYLRKFRAAAHMCKHPFQTSSDTIIVTMSYFEEFPFQRQKIKKKKKCLYRAMTTNTVKLTLSICIGRDEDIERGFQSIWSSAEVPWK